MSGFKRFQEQGPADDTRWLMCGAQGCPNRWTVDAGSGRLCSAHAWAEPQRWLDITARQQWDETERARMRNDPPPRPPRVDKRAIVERLKSLRIGTTFTRAWAERLRDREAAGDRLTPTHREMWRSALASVQSVEGDA